jgi:hypothetical protein
MAMEGKQKEEKQETLSDANITIKKILWTYR